MFGLKWLWKTNRGSNIDTSNFVSKEFLNTTLQDYVNRDLLNTTLSNELSNYVSTTSLNTTLNNYVLNSTLNTTLSSYVQTNTLNTTLQNYVQTTTLTNYVSTNTTQTISGVKTFTEGVVINKTPIPLTLKATDSNKTYIVYKDTANNSNFSLGANSAQTSLEVNRGDLLFQTQQQNKTVSFETGTIKTNRARLEFGTEINAGYGGGTVKFIPEDNSTKTLQFFNTNATDQRRFNLLVPEPSNDNSPATKRYVDTQVASIDVGNVSNQINELNTFKTSVENSLGYNLRYQDLQITSFNKAESYGIYYRLSLSVSPIWSVKFLSAVLHYGSAAGDAFKEWEFNYSTYQGSIKFIWRSLFSEKGSETFNRNGTFIRIFYIDSLEGRTGEGPYRIDNEGGN